MPNLHFTASRSDLVREMKLALGAVEKRTTIPILGNFMLRAEGSELRITATDLEISMTCYCPAQIKQAGTVTIPAKKILDFIQMLPDGDVTIKIGENNWATITSGRTKSRIAGMDPSAFPELPVPPPSICELPLADISRMVKHVVFAVSDEAGRHTLPGAKVEVGNGSALLCATDGHRLAMSKTDLESSKEVSDIISIRALGHLVDLSEVSGTGATVSYSSDENQLFFAVGKRLMTASKITGKFPDYRQIVTESYAAHAIVDCSAMKRSLNVVRGFADGLSKKIRMEIGNGEIKLTASSLGSGEGEDVISAETTGELSLFVNADYILEIVSSIQSEKTNIEFQANGGIKHAIRFSPLGGSDKQFCIVMPMHE